jgi:citrate lyase gamma subunit
MNITRLWNKPWRPDIGFSGTREGMTVHQMQMFRLLVEVLQPGNFHHGDCIGADAQAHKGAALFTKATIQVHPGPGSTMRAFCQGDIIHPPYPYLTRNHHIVNATDITIATPKEAEPVLRSGTWSTIRYSMGQHKPTVLIKPDGETVFFDGERIIMKSNSVSLTKGSSATWTSNGNGDATVIQESPNGEFAFYASGTWDSGSLKLQVSPDDSGTVWIDVASSTMTADGYKIVQVFGRRVRAVLASVATASSLTVKVVGVGSGVTRTDS